MAALVVGAFVGVALPQASLPRSRTIVVFEEPFTTSGLCHLPGGRFRYKFGQRASDFVDTITRESERRRCGFGQLTCDAFGTPLAVGVFARVARCDACADGTGSMVTVDFGGRFVPEDAVQVEPHKVMRARALRDVWRLRPGTGGSALRADVRALVARIAELRLRLAAAGTSTVPLCHERALELDQQLAQPWSAELLSFVALGVADVPLMTSKALLVTRDTRERLLYAHEALVPLAKELEAKAAIQAASATR
ncbi:hypothetical protein KFE25_001895 [Diacronema lutheri]|uniref:Lon N-terminal domain-containing protein n=1 Tax=Diacronema lutheri TaxID=2081491 RepID=A0A8J5XMI9_DIALT|nr:hypothetical protein KFE25_001895 [Diacronema lutheri]